MPEHLPIDLAYAAGIIDGEGTIGITEYAAGRQKRKSPQFRCYVAVAMCDFQVPYWLAANFGGTVHEYQYGSGRPQARWVLANRRAADFCSLIAPHLRVKRGQAEVLADFYADDRFVFKQRQSIPLEEIEARREYVTKVRALNARADREG